MEKVYNPLVTVEGPKSLLELLDIPPEGFCQAKYFTFCYEASLRSYKVGLPADAQDLFPEYPTLRVVIATGWDERVRDTIRGRIHLHLVGNGDRNYRHLCTIGDFLRAPEKLHEIIHLGKGIARKEDAIVDLAQRFYADPLVRSRRFAEPRKDGYGRVGP